MTRRVNGAYPPPCAACLGHPAVRGGAVATLYLDNERVAGFRWR